MVEFVDGYSIPHTAYYKKGTVYSNSRVPDHLIRGTITAEL